MTSSRVTLAGAAIALFASTITPAGAQQCTGPFRHCAVAVGATCERSPQGGQVMVYFDTPGRVMTFETCVGQVFEAAGQANPFKTGQSAAARGRRGGPALTVPETKIIIPLRDP